VTATPLKRSMPEIVKVTGCDSSDDRPPLSSNQDGFPTLDACSSTPVTVDRTSTPDALIVTVATLQTQNAPLATQVAELPATSWL
jgi:hypothetical protein